MTEKAENWRFFVEDKQLPQWCWSPWAKAVEDLMFGDIKMMAALLECGEPIPNELGKILAKALRGGESLPFRLKLIANPKPGSKRAGRWPARNEFRDKVLAALMKKHMLEGLSYDDAAMEVAKGGIGERLVKDAYSKYQNTAENFLDWCKDLAKVIKETELSLVLEPEPLQPALGKKCMLKGDKPLSEKKPSRCKKVRI
jgi:hypothetical protein